MSFGTQENHNWRYKRNTMKVLMKRLEMVGTYLGGESVSGWRAESRDER
jgi:hypothetical protein